MKTQTIATLLVLLATTSIVWAQEPTTQSANHTQSQALRSNTRQGNSQYNKNAYAEAEANYRKALRVDSTYHKSQYNLGSALYRQKNYSEAARYYEEVATNPSLDKRERSNAYHNLGNSQLQNGLKQRQNGADDGGMRQFQQAVTAYQEALKLNPKNQDTKYNLSYAQKLLAQAQQQKNNQKNQQQNKDQQQQNQQSKSQQSNDQQQQDQRQQERQPKDQQQQNQQQDQRRGQQDQKKEQQKKDAEQLLNAVKNNEKKTMKDQQKKATKVDSRVITEDW